MGRCTAGEGCSGACMQRQKAAAAAVVAQAEQEEQRRIEVIRINHR